VLLDLNSMNSVGRQFVALAGEYGAPCFTLRMRTGDGKQVRILATRFSSPDDADFFFRFLRERGFTAKLDTRHALRRHAVFCQDALAVGGA